ncbi:MAG TPA: carbohydrate ABC transporter permease [Acidimicrobiales bacterium]|nr:carbohydrate ABC transporter permease [Acidimicrobiales bacterium]
MSIARRAVKSIVQVPLILWSLLGVVPFVLVVALSFRSNNDIFQYPLGFGGSYHISNYVTAWNGPPGTAGEVDYFRNSALAALVTLAVSLGAGSTAAYFATKMSWRASQWLLRAFLLGTVVPFVLIVIPIYQGYNAVDGLNNPELLGIAYGALSLPTTVLILYSFFSDFPKELIDSAAVDGLGEFGTYARIVLPLSKAAITAVGIIVLVYVWGETQLGIILLQAPKSQTVAVGVLGFQGQFTSDLGPMFAGLSIAILPLLVLYLAFHRFISKGIALGGVFR